MTHQSDLSNIYGGDWSPPTRSLRAALLYSARKYSDKIVLTIPHQDASHLSELRPPGTGQHISDRHCLEWAWADLDHASHQVADGLLRSGVKAGDILVTFLPNCAEWALCYLACIKTRITLASLDPSMLNRPEELTYYIDLLKPTAVVAEATKHVPPFKKALNITCSSHNDVPGWTSLTTLAKLNHSEQFLLPLYAEDEPTNDQENIPHHILFTSGTTEGLPKGCPRSTRSFSLTADAHAQTGAMDRNTRFMISMPNYRASCMFCPMMVWKHGGSIVLLPGTSFDAGALIEGYLTHKCTHSMLAATMLYAIAAHPMLPSAFPDLRQVWLTGDIITKDMLTYGQKTFGSNVKVMPLHGMSEGKGMLEWRAEDYDLDAEVPVMDGGIAAVGRVALGARVRIAGLDSNAPVRIGEEGEIHLCSPVQIESYMGGRNAHEFYEDDEGKWFKTGDVGKIDADGLVYILSRVKDIIKYQGIPVSPTMIEVVLNKDPEVMVSYAAACIPSCSGLY